MTNASNYGGAIYLDEKDIPVQIQVQGNDETYDGESHPFEFEADWTTQTSANATWSRRLARWDDFSSIQTKTTCAKYAHIGGAKICVGWKTQERHIINSATLIVQLKTAEDIKKDINDCVATAVIAAAIAAIVSGGAAAAAAAEKLFFACLKAKLGEALISVRVHTSSSWSKWS